MKRQAALGMQERLGEALIEGALIKREQLKSAQEVSRNTGKKLEEVLIDQELVSPETIATVLSFQLNAPVIDLRQARVQPEALHLIPENIAREHSVLPLSVEGDTLRVAMDNPQDQELINTLSALTQRRIKPVIVFPLRRLTEIINSNYQSTARLAEEIVEVIPPLSEQPLPEMLKQLKSDFLLALSHELRTPLTSLKSSAYLLLEEVDGLANPSLSRLAKLIKESTEGLDEVISKLLYRMRLEDKLEISSTPYDIAELIQAKVEQITPLAESKGQHIEIEALPSGVMATIPPKRFKEIVDNLLSNAHRFTPEGGRISIALRKEKNRFVVEVSDTGIGIPKEEQEQIFDIFYRAKGARMRGIAGSGLGLSITKRVVEMYGGKIWFSSTVDKGSTFSFSLPMIIMITE
ncbi:MAG TPA: ATP-binding protein [Dehalococcoidia bacterium]|nr:ATP-binding protein [Dehalococcoidia bacterium]